jgi:hypothetical protein
MKALALTSSVLFVVCACSSEVAGDSPSSLPATGTTTPAPAEPDTPMPAPPPSSTSSSETSAPSGPLDLPWTGIYASTDRSLYHFDPKAKTLRKLGDFKIWDVALQAFTGLTGVRNIAMDRNAGMIYALRARGTETVVVECNRVSTECVDWRPRPSGERLDGLTFVHDPTDTSKDVLLSTRRGELVRVSTYDAAVAPIGSLGLPADRRIDEMAELPVGATFALDAGQAGDQRLVRIDPVTGALQAVVGNVGARHVAGLASWGAVLYGFTEDRHVVVVDTLTATLTDVVTAAQSDAAFTGATVMSAATQAAVAATR